MSRIVLPILQLLLFLTPFEVFAYYGDSCAPVPNINGDSDISSNTAYGHIIGNLDMTSYTGKNACDPSNNLFKFCLKNSSGHPTCTSLILGNSKKLSEVSNSPSLGGDPFLKDIELTVTQLSEVMCLTMPTSRGPLPLACKKMSPDAPDTTNLGPVTPGIPTCTALGKSCYDGNSKSHSLFNFSGLAIHCVKETLDNVFYARSNCNPQDSNSLTLLNPFSAFQEALKVSIRAALIIYVIFYGFNIVLNYEYLNLNKVAMFLIKFLLVAYFSVGLGPVQFNFGKETTQNGMVDQGLPFLTQVLSDFTQIVFTSGGSKGLCEFGSTNDDSLKYEQGYEFYSVWDSIDCRIAYYLGMQLVYDATALLKSAGEGVVNSVGNAANLDKAGVKGGIDALKNVGGWSFFVVLFGFLMAGNIVIVISGLAFALMVLSIVLYFITHYLVCMITLYVMAYISPIFIPMALFTYTKAYFDSWLKVTLSCVLQPAIAAGFIALLLGMYDSAIYKNCQFSRHSYSLAGIKFSTYELRVPDKEAKECTGSAGYKLIEYYAGKGWEETNAIIFTIYSIRDIFLLIIDLLYVFVFTVIFYFFSQSVREFCSEITSGPSMAAVTASPKALVDLVRKAAKYLSKPDQASQMKPDNNGKKDGKDEKDGDKNKEEKASDSASTSEGGKDAAGGGGGAADKISSAAKGAE